MITLITTTPGRMTIPMSAGHSHAPDNFGWAFAIGASLNTAFVIAELIFGYAANSLALISAGPQSLRRDRAAAGMGRDVVAQKQPTQRHTYGYRRASILAALFNAGLLLVAVGGIVVEAVDRLYTPAPVAGRPSSWSRRSVSPSTAARRCCSCAAVTAISISAAPICTWRPMPAALGVVVAAASSWLTGWLWLDPAISLVIAAVVFWSGWGLARDSVSLALDGVPRGIELVDVRDYLAGLEGISEVHDLHVWAMSTNETALTAHLVRPGGTDDAFLHRVCEELSNRFNIHHPTLQIEVAAGVCKLAPAERV